MPRNRRGAAVDPVPFLVVAATGFLLTLSVGPIYGVSFGLPLELAVAASAACWLCGTAAAYHRLVWTARPDHREHVPASGRLERIGLAALAAVLVLLLLSLPLFVR